jgi:hypothetical protein
MPYLLVQDFKLGLDSRRNELTSPAGSLMLCSNAHISRGGEVEKRHCFEKIATLPDKHFGLEVTSDSLFVFALERDVTEASAAQLKNNGVSIQVLKHPYDPNGTGWDIDKLIWSTVYDGKIFFIVRFVNKNNTSEKETYCYYDEQKQRELLGAVRIYRPTIVKDTYKGMVGNGSIASTKTAAEVTSELFGFLMEDERFSQSTIGTGADANKITVTGLIEKSFDIEARRMSSLTQYPSASNTSVTVVESQSAVDGTPPTSAFTEFSITGGKAGNAVGSGFGRCPFSLVIPMKISQVLINDIDIAYVPVDSRITYLDNDQPILIATEKLTGAVAKFINANTPASGYTATAKHDPNWGEWNLAGFMKLTVTAPAINSTDYNGDEIWFELDNTLQECQGFAYNHRSGGSFLLASTIMESDKSKTGAVATNSEGTFKLMRLTNVFSGGSTNSISSITIDDFEILGVEQFWTTSNGQLSSDVIDQINDYQSQYDAEIINGKINIKHALGGAAENGKQMAVVNNGAVTISSYSVMTGGVTSNDARSQISVITIGASATEPVGKGTRIEINTKYEDDQSYKTHCASDITGTSPTFAMVYKSKMHLTAGPSVFFSALNNPLSWDPQEAGAGYVNFSENFSTRYDIVCIAPYKSQLAVFGQNNTQIWGWDPNPELNSQQQVLANTGAVGAGSIVQLGDVDVFYVSSSGIRSLRARDATDSAMSSDVGTQIDTLIEKEIAEAGPEYNISSVIEPNSGRYMMSINDKIYVLSQFTGSQIQAWSTYDPLLGNIDRMVSSNTDVFIRCGNFIYKLSRVNYVSPDDYNVARVTMPYLDGEKPAHSKTFSGVDAAIVGTWQVWAGTNTSNTDAKELIATISHPTFQVGRIQMVGLGTHVGATMISTSSNERATIANLMIHYRLDKAD